MRTGTLLIALALSPLATLRLAQDAGAERASRNPTPAEAQDSLGKAVFTGKGNCHVCHGAEGKGGPLGPDLSDDQWLHIDGKVESIADLIRKGVPAPKQFPAPMLPMGGAQLTDVEVQAVARYVASLSATG